MPAKLPVVALPALSRNASVSAAVAAATDVINVQIIAPPAPNPEAASSVAGEISADIMAQL